MQPINDAMRKKINDMVADLCKPSGPWNSMRAEFLRELLDISDRVDTLILKIRNSDR